MRKRLSAIGNSLGVILEKPILELLGIDKDTELELSTDGERLIVRTGASTDTPDDEWVHEAAAPSSPEVVHYRVRGRTFQVTGGSFFQVNLPQAERLRFAEGRSPHNDRRRGIRLAQKAPEDGTAKNLIHEQQVGLEFSQRAGGILEIGFGRDHARSADAFQEAAEPFHGNRFRITDDQSIHTEYKIG